jgi:hypothetical protein
MNIAQLQQEVDFYQSRLATWVLQSYENSREVVQRSLGSAFPVLHEADSSVISDASATGSGDSPTALPTVSPEGIVQLPLPTFLPVTDEIVDSAAKLHRTNHAQWEIFGEQVAGHQVEIYKKHALAFACLIFVLLAPPLALRFPRGGVGMVISLSLGIFFLYWMGLIGGERLADRGRIDPLLAMWAPNIILLIPALLLISGMAKQMSSNRGGTLDEIAFRVRELTDRIFRRSTRRPAEGRSGGAG